MIKRKSKNLSKWNRIKHQKARERKVQGESKKKRCGM